MRAVAANLAEGDVCVANILFTLGKIMQMLNQSIEHSRASIN